jgi:hypothetical protein
MWNFARPKAIKAFNLKPSMLSMNTILIDKLDYFGVRGVVKNGFASYLNNQKQQVAITTNITSSEYCCVQERCAFGSIYHALFPCT